MKPRDRRARRRALRRIVRRESLARRRMRGFLKRPTWGTFALFYWALPS